MVVLTVMVARAIKTPGVQESTMPHENVSTNWKEASVEQLRSQPGRDRESRKSEVCSLSLISGGRLDSMSPVCNITVIGRECNDACMSAFKFAPRVSPKKDCRKDSLASQMCQGSCCAAQCARRFLTPDTFVSGAFIVPVRSAVCCCSLRFTH